MLNIIIGYFEKSRFFFLLFIISEILNCHWPIYCTNTHQKEKICTDLYEKPWWLVDICCGWIWCWLTILTSVYTTLVTVCFNDHHNVFPLVFICTFSASHIYSYSQQHSEQLKSACCCFLKGWHLCLSSGDVDAPGGRSMEVFSGWWHSLWQYWLRNNVQKQTNRLLRGFLRTSTWVWVTSICESNEAHPAADVVMRKQLILISTTYWYT